MNPKWLLRFPAWRWLKHCLCLVPLRKPNWDPQNQSRILWWVCLQLGFSTFPNDHQTQHSGLGPLINVQNLFITGSTFASLSHWLCINDFAIIVHRLELRTMIMSILSLPILLKCRQRFWYTKNQIPVHCLLDGKMYWTNLARFLFIMLTVA